MNVSSLGLSLVFLFLISIFVQASNLEPQVTDKSFLQYYPKSVIVNEVVRFKPIKGYQINLEAPNKCAPAKDVEITKNYVSCQYKESGVYQSKIYVCDDKKTNCFIQKVTVSLNKKMNRSSFISKIVLKIESLFKKKKVKKSFPKETKTSPNKKITGFIQNDIETAKKLAVQEKKPILIYYTQLHCPPCKLMEDIVLSEPTFFSVGSEYILLQLDSDFSKIAPIAKSLNLKSTPTFILVDARLQEIGRKVGFVSVQGLQNWLFELKPFQNQPLSGLDQESMAKKSPTDHQVRSIYKRLSVNEFNSYNFEKALKWLNPIKDDANMKSYYEASKAQLSQGEESIVWTEKVVSDSKRVCSGIFKIWGIAKDESLKDKKYYRKKLDLVKKAHKKIIDKGKYARLQSDCQLALAYLKQIEGIIHKSYKKIKKSHSAIHESIDLIKKMAKNKTQQNSKGISLFVASAMRALEEKDKANKIYQELVKKEKDNFSFEYFQAAFYLKDKKYDKALEFINKSEAKATAANWFKVKILKLSILVVSKKKVEAENEIHGILASVNLPEDSSFKVHSFMSELRDYQGQLKKIKAAP